MKILLSMLLLALLSSGLQAAPSAAQREEMIRIASEDEVPVIRTTPYPLRLCTFPTDQNCVSYAVFERRDPLLDLVRRSSAVRIGGPPSGR